MTSNGVGATASAISGTMVTSLVCSVDAGVAGGGAAGCSGAADRRTRISPRRPGQTRCVAFGRAHFLDRREQRRLIHFAAVPESKAPPRQAMLPK